MILLSPNKYIIFIKETKKQNIYDKQERNYFITST